MRLNESYRSNVAGRGPLRTEAFTVVEASISDMRSAMEQKRITSRELVNQYLIRIAIYDHLCSGTEVSVNVDPTQLTDSVFFSPTGILGISNNISLAANANFASIENDAPSLLRNLQVSCWQGQASCSWRPGFFGPGLLRPTADFRFQSGSKQ